MKKVFLFAVFALIFGIALTTSTNAQVVSGTKKVAKKTNNGLHKGWIVGKRVGQKSWRKGKRVSVKGYRKTKRVTVKGTKATVDKVKDVVN